MPGTADRNTAPKNHIHEMPSSERNTTMFSRASFRLRQVSLIGFQLMRSAGSVDGEAGIACATRGRGAPGRGKAHAVARAPTSGIAISRPPATLPSRIATKVPISTMPLPPVSSRSDRCCGRYGELDRAEQGRVQPHQEDAGQQDRHVRGREAPAGEQHDRDLEPLDEADQRRLVVLVGELSAGRREQQERQDEEGADRQPASSVGSHSTRSWYVTITVNANLNRLSLPAPRNWVQKNGPKRRWPSSAN
jgi:hypothetical protein